MAALKAVGWVHLLGWKTVEQKVVMREFSRGSLKVVRLVVHWEPWKVAPRADWSVDHWVHVREPWMGRPTVVYWEPDSARQWAGRWVAWKAGWWGPWSADD